MPQITLNRAQALQLNAFCAKHKKDTFFIAKDHGAYLGASVGAKPEDKCIFYFKGCDPQTNPDDFYHNAVRLFGGDDMGEFLPVSVMSKFATDPKLESVTLKVNKRSISAVYTLRK